MISDGCDLRGVRYAGPTLPTDCTILRFSDGAVNRNLLLAIGMVATISGCGGGSSQVSGPPPPPAVSVTLSTMPPAVLGTGGTASVAATVQNDSAAGGVTWSCTPAAACGAFSPTSTPSGSMTTYTAPATVPTGGSVTIIATSITDSSKSANAKVLISGTASNATLKGQYAFLILAPTGNPTTKGATTFAGSVNVDGNGNILGGVEDIVSTIYRDQADAILATSADPFSSYSVDSSGHGKMAFHTQHGETLSLSFVLTSSSHAVVIETGGDPGSGTLDLQSGNFATSQISGGYSFTMEGVDPAVPPTAKVAFGGVFSSDGQGNITGGTLDSNIGGTVSSETFTGMINPPIDSNGRGVFTVVPVPGTTRTFTFYIVSPKVLRLFEADNVDLVGGSAYAQGAATAALSGKFVFEHSGWTSTGRAVAAGQLTADGMSKITGGVSDANQGGAAPTTPSLAQAVSGTFAFTSGLEGTLNLTDAAGSSTFNMYMIDPSLNSLDPNSSSSGGGALLLHTDANIIGIGALLPQISSTPAGIVGNQGLNLQNCVAAATPNEVDLVGVVTSDGSGNLSNGAADYDQSNSPNSAGPFTGTFAADAANPGRFTGSFAIPTPAGGYPFIPPSVTSLNVSFYQLSGAQILLIQTDNTANASGYLLQQLLP
jgi:hypothetical protein